MLMNRAGEIILKVVLMRGRKGATILGSCKMFNPFVANVPPMKKLSALAKHVKNTSEEVTFQMNM